MKVKEEFLDLNDGRFTAMVLLTQSLFSASDHHFANRRTDDARFAKFVRDLVQHVHCSCWTVHLYVSVFDCLDVKA
jgi:hypothetical protein